MTHDQNMILPTTEAATHGEQPTCILNGVYPFKRKVTSLAADAKISSHWPL